MANQEHGKLTPGMPIPTTDTALDQPALRSKHPEYGPVTPNDIMAQIRSKPTPPVAQGPDAKAVRSLHLTTDKNGYFVLGWELEPGTPTTNHDFVAVYNHHPAIGQYDSDYVSGAWEWVNHRNTLLDLVTKAKYRNNGNSQYIAYVTWNQVSSQYETLKTREMPTPDHELRLHLDDDKNLEIWWNQQTNVGYYDWVALYDFRPDRDQALKYSPSHWRWVSGQEGAYRPGVRKTDLGSTPFAAYCREGESGGYVVAATAGLVKQYRVKNLEYKLGQAERPALAPVQVSTMTLRNPMLEKALVKDSLSVEAESDRSWDFGRSVKFGVKTTFEGKVPLIGGGKWELSSELDLSLTTGEAYKKTVKLDSEVSVEVPPGMQVTVDAVLSTGKAHVEFQCGLEEMFEGSEEYERPKCVAGMYNGVAEVNLVLTAHQVEHIAKDTSELEMRPRKAKRFEGGHVIELEPGKQKTLVFDMDRHAWVDAG